MPLQNENTYTTDYIYSLPEGQRAELINGIVYNMAPPSRLHQEIVMNLSAEIRDYIKINHGSCKVYPAPFAVFLNKDNKTYVELFNSSFFRFNCSLFHRKAFWT